LFNIFNIVFVDGFHLFFQYTNGQPNEKCNTMVVKLQEYEALSYNDEGCDKE